MSQRFAGSSFTIANPGYSYTAQTWQQVVFADHAFTFTNQALGGHNTWSNLVRLVTGSDLFILDHANDGNTVKDKSSLEAVIRRLWTDNPATRVILVESPSWNTLDTSDNAIVDHPYNEAVLGNLAALAAHYGIPLVEYWQWCKATVPGTYDLTELTADTVHPTTLGYNNMALLLEAFLPAGGAAAPSPLPARLYAETADYENTPTVKTGTAYDSKTGTWSEGTPANSVSSSEVGATITYSTTCQSFGCYRADGVSNDVQVSIDGGAFTDSSFYQNGTAIAGVRAAHTIAIKVKSGTVRIDQFWAI